MLGSPPADDDLYVCNYYIIACVFSMLSKTKVHLSFRTRTWRLIILKEYPYTRHDHLKTYNLFVYARKENTLFFLKHLHPVHMHVLLVSL
jgi:hypothetical protein